MKKFIQGIIFIVLLLPLLETFINIIQQSAKWLCTWIAVKTVEIERTLEDEESETPDRVVGFRVPNLEDSEEAEKEWEDENYDE